MIMPMLARAADERQAKVSAATAAAVEGIVQDICAQSIGSNLTVRELVTRTETLDDLRQAVGRAQQIGGPRWIDEQTCQVHLEINGARIAPVLTLIAKSKHKQSPIDADLLAVRLKDWGTRTFGATGSSTGEKTLELVRPPDGAWAGVEDPVRQQVVMQARQNAIQRVVDSVRPIELKPNLPVSSLLDKKESPLAADLRNYLVTRPVTRVRFTEQRQVELTLSAPALDIFEVVHWAAAQPPSAVLAYEDRGWAVVRESFIQKVAPAVGNASVDDVIKQPPPAVAIPTQAPAWSTESLIVDGTATVQGSKLKVARVAEDDARRKIAALVGDLPLDGMTIAEAARRDPRFADLLVKSVGRGRLVKAEYKADGTVEARITLDLRQLWEDIQGLR